MNWNILLLNHREAAHVKRDISFLTITLNTCFSLFRLLVWFAEASVPAAVSEVWWCSMAPHYSLTTPRSEGQSHTVKTHSEGRGRWWRGRPVSPRNIYCICKTHSWQFLSYLIWRDLKINSFMEHRTKLHVRYTVNVVDYLECGVFELWRGGWGGEDI